MLLRGYNSLECVAESTRTPLLALTVADIGTDEQAMERKLSRWLQLATNWNAIILIDEADVFLEKRRVEADALRRNSLVSGEAFFLNPRPCSLKLG